MEKREAVLSLDVGTTHIKAMLWDRDLNLLHGHSVRNQTDTVGEEGPAYEPAALLARVKEAVRGALAQAAGGARITALGLTGMADSGLLVDREGRPLTTVIPWGNPCGREYLPAIRNAFPAEELYRVTGQVLHPKFPPARLLWYKERRPDAFRRAHKWLSLCDYILYRLTGRFVTDQSLACRTMLYDIRRLDWSAPVCRHFGVEGRLPQVIPAGGTAGLLWEAGAQWLGLPGGIPVASGGHDHPCALHALTRGTDSKVLDSMGTSEVFVGVREGPALPDDAYAMGLHQGCFAGGHYWLASFPSSGASLEWFRGLLSAGYELYDHNPEPDAGGVCFVPRLNGGGAPSPDPAGAGAFLGLTARTTAGHMARAIHQGLACQARRIYDALEAIPGCGIGEAAAAGGGARNRPLLQAKADVTGKPLLAVRMEELTGYGAALAAAEAAGHAPRVRLPADRIVPGEGCPGRHEADYRRWLAACEAVAGWEKGGIL